MASRSWPRLPMLGVAVVAGALCGCGGSGPDELAYRDETNNVELTAELTANWDSLEAQTASANTATTHAFDDAVASLGERYRFESRVTGGKSGLVELVGRRVDGAVQYSMTAGGATLEVVDLGDALWSRVSEGSWGQSNSVTAADPLAALRQPLSVERGPASGTFVVTYDRSSLGFEGDEPLTLMALAVDSSASQKSSVTFSTIDEKIEMTSILESDPGLEPVTNPE